MKITYYLAILIEGRTELSLSNECFISVCHESKQENVAGLTHNKDYG